MEVCEALAELEDGVEVGLGDVRSFEGFEDVEPFEGCGDLRGEDPGEVGVVELREVDVLLARWCNGGVETLLQRRFMEALF